MHKARTFFVAFIFPGNKLHKAKKTENDVKLGDPPTGALLLSSGQHVS
jgi:hypothetical protein